MGIGYALGCLLSILLWKIDREKILNKVFNKIKSIVRINIIYEIIFVLIACIIYFLTIHIRKNEIYNFVTAFLIIDISSTERKNIEKADGIHFYDSVSDITKALVEGFIAPLFYTFIFKNSFGLIYALLVKYCDDETKGLAILKGITNILPAILTEVPMYIVYAARNRKFKINFKGDFLLNSIERPLLNIDIMAAYIEKVNFYYCRFNGRCEYLKSYGQYVRKIDIESVKDYLGITYGIALLYFVIMFFYFFIF